MNTLIINLEGNDFKLTSFFDCDKGNGVTVKDGSTNKIIGEIWGMSIPDQKEVEEDPDGYVYGINMIENHLENWLLNIEYYY